MTTRYQSKRMKRLGRMAISLAKYPLPQVSYTDRRKFPAIPCVYLVFKRGRLVYVGQTTNLRRRWQWHSIGYRYNLKGTKVAFLEEPNHGNRITLEHLLILVNRPHLNGDYHYGDTPINEQWQKVIKRARNKAKEAIR